MKKLLVVVMSIIMVLSLCACGGKGAGGNGGLLSSEPTEQENEVISTYVNILNALENYLEDGEISIYDVENEVDVEGSKALEYCYMTIQELESVDKWIGTEYISDTRTRKEILDSFAILKNVKLQEKTVSLDNLGNVMREYVCGSYQYNAKGEIIEGYLSHADGHFILGEYDKIGLNFMINNCLREYACFYGESGKLDYVQDDSDRITPIYDNEGKMISVEHLTADGYKEAYSLSYDDENRVSRMEENRVKDEGLVDTYHFTYNDNKLIRVEHDTKNFNIEGTPEKNDSYTDYVYDENGKLTSAVETNSEGWEKRLTVSYAQEGNLVTYHIEQHDNEGNVKYTFKQERTYGDFYIYNPNK